MVYNDGLEEYVLFCGAGAHTQLVGKDSSAEHPSSPTDKQMNIFLHMHSHMRMDNPPPPGIYIKLKVWHCTALKRAGLKETVSAHLWGVETEEGCPG